MSHVGWFYAGNFDKLSVLLNTVKCLLMKVTTPKQIGFHRGLWGNYIPGFNLIAVKCLSYHAEMGVFRQTDGRTDIWAAP